MPLSSKALTTVDNAKLYIGIPAADTSSDAFIEELINIVSDKICKLIGRNLEKATYTDERYEGTGNLELILNNYPVVSVADVKIDDETVTDYEIITAATGVLYRENLWPIMAGTVFGMQMRPDKLKKNIKVTYDAGYVLPKDDGAPNPRTLPYDLEGVAKSAVSSIFNQAGTEGLKGFKISDVNWQFGGSGSGGDAQGVFTSSDMMTLNAYKSLKF